MINLKSGGHSVLKGYSSSSIARSENATDELHLLRITSPYRRSRPVLPRLAYCNLRRILSAPRDLRRLAQSH